MCPLCKEEIKGNDLICSDCKEFYENHEPFKKWLEVNGGILEED